MESFDRGHEVIRGEVTGTRDFSQLTLTWLKSRDELEKEWQKSDRGERARAIARNGIRLGNWSV